MTAPSLLCIENTVFPFRWRDDGREKGSWVEVGGQGRSLLQTSNFKILVLISSQKESERQTVRREGMRDQEKEEEEGRKRKKTTTAQRSA